MQADLPPNETERLKSLRSYEILDTPPEQMFDDITLLASQLCGTPTAMISLIDENRQWFKSSVGMQASESSREMSFCAYGILQDDLFLVEDAQADERFASHSPGADSHKARFYAGAPLVTPEGHALGMLCVTDQVPRTLSQAQKEALKALSRQVIALLQFRRSLAETRKERLQLMAANEELAWQTAFLEAQVNASNDGILVVDQRDQKILQNQRFSELFRIPPEVVNDHSDEPTLQWVAGLTKDPAQFLRRITSLNSSQDEVGADEIELSNGVVLDRFSSPVSGKDGNYYGRIWVFRDITEQKRAEALLRESEEKFRHLAENITDAFWIRSVDMKTVHYVSPGYTQIWGRPTDSLYTNPHKWADVILPEDRERVAEIYSRLMTSEAQISVEYRILRPDGSIRWVHARGFQVKDSEGTLVRLAGIVTDITARKQIEEALREKDALIRIAGAVTRTGGWAVRVSDQQVFWSDEVFELLGYPHGTSPPLADALSLYPPEFRDKISAALESCSREGTPFDLESEIITHSARQIWVRVCGEAERDSNGTIHRVQGAFQDITDRKQAEAELAFERNLLVALLENSHDYVYFKDVHCRFIKVSRALADRFQLASSDSMVGKTDFDFFLEEHARVAFEDEQEILRTGTPMVNKIEKEQWHDGRPDSWVITAKMPFRNQKGEIIGIMGTSKDITAIKEAEVRSFQSQKMETIGKLAGGIAHEFNSILTAIMGQSELLLNDLPDSNPLRNNAAEISKASARAATLTRQLLAYGRKQILQPAVLDLNAIVAGMEGTLLHLAGREVEFRAILAEGLKGIRVDAGQIEQVIVNIVMNAVDAMPHGGNLTLETANATLDAEYVRLFPEVTAGEYVMMAISDTGFGMSQEVKSRLFEPFFSTKGIGQGTGLGLATCHGIIQQSGGHINLHSELGRGSTFKIYLPQVESAARPAVRAQSTPNVQAGTETILLIEADPALREMATVLLVRLGYTVWAAANGIEAMSLAQRKETGLIDLLYTDVVMSRIGGDDWAGRIQSLFPRMVTLFTSAHGENSILPQGTANERMAFLQKPFTPSALARKVRETLDCGASLTKQ